MCSSVQECAVVYRRVHKSMQLTIVLPLHLSMFLLEQILLLLDLSKGECWSKGDVGQKENVGH